MDLRLPVPLVPAAVTSTPAAPVPHAWELADATELIPALNPTNEQLELLGVSFWNRLERLITASFTVYLAAPLVPPFRDPELQRVIAGLVGLALLEDGELLPGHDAHAGRLRAMLRGFLFGILEDRESTFRGLAARLLASPEVWRDRYERMMVEEQLAFYRHDCPEAEATLALLAAGQAGSPAVSLVPRSTPVPPPRPVQVRPADVLYEQARRWLLGIDGPRRGHTAARQLDVAITHRLPALAELMAGLNETCQLDGSLRQHRYYLLATLEELFAICEGYLERRPHKTRHRLYHFRPYEEVGVWRIKGGSFMEERREEARFFVEMARLANSTSPARICVCRVWRLAGTPLERIEDQLSIFEPNRGIEPTEMELFELHRMRFRPLLPA